MNKRFLISVHACLCHFIPLGMSENALFLVFTWRHRRHVGVPWTKDFSLASMVRDPNMAAMSLSFYSLRNEWKRSIVMKIWFPSSIVAFHRAFAHKTHSCLFVLLRSCRGVDLVKVVFSANQNSRTIFVLHYDCRLMQEQSYHSDITIYRPWRTIIVLWHLI
jgi:hypothetical protein